jgi:site-specific DNA-cytosine methylase
VVELFAGLGCVPRGFERSGLFQAILLSDVDEDARDTFVANRPGDAKTYLKREVRRVAIARGGAGPA